MVRACPTTECFGCRSLLTSVHLHCACHSAGGLRAGLARMLDRPYISLRGACRCAGGEFMWPLQGLRLEPCARGSCCVRCWYERRPRWPLRVGDTASGRRCQVQFSWRCDGAARTFQAPGPDGVQPSGANDCHCVTRRAARLCDRRPAPAADGELRTRRAVIARPQRACAQPFAHTSIPTLM